MTPASTPAPPWGAARRRATDAPLPHGPVRGIARAQAAERAPRAPGRRYWDLAREEGRLARSPRTRAQAS